MNIEAFGKFLKFYGPLDPKGEGDRKGDEEDRGSFIEGDIRTGVSMMWRLHKLLRAP